MATDVAAQATTFSIIYIRLYVPIVTLSIQDNTKLLEQLKPEFERTTDPSFQGVKRLFVLPFENETQRISYKPYYLPTIEIKDYNVTIDRQIFFDQPVRNNLIASDNIRKITATQGDDYTTGCLVDYNYFKSYYKMIGIDLIKKQAFDADPKAIWIDFTGNLERQATIFFIIKEAKETVLDLSQGTVKVF